MIIVLLRCAAGKTKCESSLGTMYHDVPKKKQACRSCHLSMRGYVYDRVTDGFLV
jgi:hypothetical protein